MIFGGAGRIRTADKGFAGLCLTTWLRRRAFPFVFKIPNFEPIVKGGIPEDEPEGLLTRGPVDAAPLDLLRRWHIKIHGFVTQ